MSFPKRVWDQIKNITAGELIAALERDGWERDSESRSGAPIAFLKPGGSSSRVVIHYHPRKTYGPNMLKALLRDIGWTAEDLIRLKLAK